MRKKRRGQMRTIWQIKTGRQRVASVARKGEFFCGHIVDLSLVLAQTWPGGGL